MLPNQFNSKDDNRYPIPNQFDSKDGIGYRCPWVPVAYFAIGLYRVGIVSVSGTSKNLGHRDSHA